MGSSGNECSAFDSGVLFSELRPTDALVSANSVQTAAVLGTDSLGCPCDCSGSGSGVLFFGNRAGRLRQVFRAFRSPRSRSGLGSPSSASLGPIVLMSEDAAGVAPTMEAPQVTEPAAAAAPTTEAPAADAAPAPAPEPSTEAPATVVQTSAPPAESVPAAAAEAPPAAAPAYDPNGAQMTSAPGAENMAAMPAQVAGMQQAPAGQNSDDFNQWLLQGVKGVQHAQQQGQAMQPGQHEQQQQQHQQQQQQYHQQQQQQQQQYQQQQHQQYQQQDHGMQQHPATSMGHQGYGGYDGYGQGHGGYGHPADGMHHMAAAAVQEEEQMPLPELPLCPFEVKKLRVPEIKAMLNTRGIHMEMMQGVLKKDLLEMLIEKLDEEGNLKDDPPEKKPRVYIEDDGQDEDDDDGALEEEEDEEYDPVSDVSGAEQDDDDTIWNTDI